MTRIAALGLAVSLGLALGCNGILGIEEKRYVAAPTSGGGEGGGAGAGQGASGGAGHGAGGGGGGGCGADLDSDPDNCGACGHGCLGGDCQSGKCQPVFLAAGGLPSRVALDATHVYWTDYEGGRIRRIPKAGGAAQQIYQSALGAQHYPWDVAVDDDGVFFTIYNFNEIPPGYAGRMAKDGSGMVPLAEGVQGPWGLALDATHLYWANRWDTRAVTRVPRGGGALSVLVSGPPVSDMAAFLAVDDTFVYWPDNLAGTISRMPKAGGEIEVIATGAKSPTHVVADGDHVFWVDEIANLGDDLWRAGKDGSDPQIIAMADAIGGVAPDGEHVYYTVFSGPTYPHGAVMRARKDGTEKPETLAYGFTGASGLAVDAQAVYFACQFDASVMRLAK